MVTKLRSRILTYTSNSSHPTPHFAMSTSPRGSATVSSSLRTVMTRTHSSLLFKLSNSTKLVTWTIWSTQREIFRNSRELARSDRSRSWPTCKFTPQSIQDLFMKSTYRSTKRTYASSTGSPSALKAVTVSTLRASLLRIQVHFTSKSQMFRRIAYLIKQTLP